MAIVLILDQRKSSGGPDLVAPFLGEVNPRFAEKLRRPFARTAGDEMQALLADATGLGPILSHAFTQRTWWVGVGLGSVDRIGATTPESAGAAFKAARDAVDAAKRHQRAPGPVSVRGEPVDRARQLQASLGALAFIVGKRTARQSQVVAAVEHGRTRLTAAQSLSVTPQTVSRILVAAGYEQEQELNGLISDLARESIDAD